MPVTAKGLRDRLPFNPTVLNYFANLEIQLLRPLLNFNGGRCLGLNPTTNGVLGFPRERPARDRSAIVRPPGGESR